MKYFLIKRVISDKLFSGFYATRDKAERNKKIALLPFQTFFLKKVNFTMCPSTILMVDIINF